MCGRFTLTTPDATQLALDLGIEPDSALLERYRPRYNIAPTDQHWIVRARREERQIWAADWGLRNSWQRDPKRPPQINARAETLTERPAFRDAFRQRRCVVPADGFFEWTGPKQARRPLWFHQPEGGLIYFAGLYESWRPTTADEWQRSFTIVTTEANALMAPVHDRMPVLLTPDRIDDWLYADAEEPLLRSLLVPPPEGALIATTVSTRVNAVRNDDPACLEPVPTLF